MGWVRVLSTAPKLHKRKSLILGKHYLATNNDLFLSKQILRITYQDHVKNRKNVSEPVNHCLCPLSHKCSWWKFHPRKVRWNLSSSQQHNLPRFPWCPTVSPCALNVVKQLIRLHMHLKSSSVPSSSAFAPMHIILPPGLYRISRTVQVSFT